MLDYSIINNYNFIKNQNVNINKEAIIITVKQNISTPGIRINNVKFYKNSLYNIFIDVRNLNNIKAFFWCNNTKYHEWNKKQFLIEGLNIIKIKTNNIEEILDIGILIYQPVINDMLIINSFNVVKEYVEDNYVIIEKKSDITEENNIVELIEDFNEISKLNNNLRLNIYYNKIVGNIEFTNKINNIMHNSDKSIINYIYSTESDNSLIIKNKNSNKIITESLTNIFNELEIIILIIFHNIEKNINDLLDSLHLQNNKNFSIIFYDNCSSDNSQNLIINNIKNIKYEYIKNNVKEETHTIFKKLISKLKNSKNIYDNKIFMIIDSNDLLYNEHSLSIIRDKYLFENPSLTYGNNLGLLPSYSSEITKDKYLNMKIDNLDCGLPITFKYEILKNVRDDIFYNSKEDRNINNNIYRILLYELLQISKYSEIKLIKEAIYINKNNNDIFEMTINDNNDILDINYVNNKDCNLLCFTNIFDILLQKHNYKLKHKHSIKFNCILKSESTYNFNFIRKNIDSLLLTLKIKDKNNNIIHNRKLIWLNMIYTSETSHYEVEIINNSKKDIEFNKNETLKIDYISAYNHNTLKINNIYNKEFLIICVNFNNVTDCKELIELFNIMKKKYEIYIVISNYKFNKGENDELLLNYIETQLSKYLISNHEFTNQNIKHLLQILNERFGDKYNIIYYTENNENNENLQIKDNIDNDVYNYFNCNYENNDKKVVSLATYLKRKELVKDTIKSLIDQVDFLNVYFNGYPINEIKLCLETFNNNEKLRFVSDSLGTLRASGKFFWSNEDNYNFTCDDDIIYANNYINHSMNFFEKDKDYIYSYLGAIFPENIIYFPNSNNRKISIKFTEKSSELLKVHLAGTGVSFFKTSKYPDLAYFMKHVCYNDDLLAIYCKKNNITIISVPKEEKWLTSHEDMDLGLYEEKGYDKTSAIMLDYYIKMNPWTI